MFVRKRSYAKISYGIEFVWYNFRNGKCSEAKKIVSDEDRKHAKILYGIKVVREKVHKDKCLLTRRS